MNGIGNFSVTSSEFINSSSTLAGSCILARVFSGPLRFYCGFNRFSECSADGVNEVNAVALVGINGTGIIEFCEFHDCFGGGASSKCSNFTLRSSLFSRCHQLINGKNGGGGGFQTYHDTSSRGSYFIYDTIFRECYGAPTGGGIELNQFPPLIICNCSFESCRVSTVPKDPATDEGCGGGIYITERPDNSVSIISCQFLNNSAEISGGALYSDTDLRNAACSINIVSSYFSNNTCLSGTGASTLCIERSYGFNLTSCSFEFTSISECSSHILIQADGNLDTVFIDDNCFVSDRTSSTTLIRIDGNISITFSNWNRFSHNSSTSCSFGNDVIVSDYSSSIFEISSCASVAVPTPVASPSTPGSLSAESAPILPTSPSATRPDSGGDSSAGSSALSPGAVAGIAISVVVLAAAIIGVALFVFKVGRRHHSDSNLPVPGPDGFSSDVATCPATYPATFLNPDSPDTFVFGEEGAGLWAE
jgi:predicted outer membrane repeat protein